MLADFEIKRVAGYDFLVFRNLEDAGLAHGFSTSGVDYRPDKRAQIAGDLKRSLGLSEILTLEQVHGDLVLSAREVVDSPRHFEGDGLTAKFGERGQRVALAVKTADCMPALFVAKDRVAMVHAGWRGAAAGIMLKAAEFFEREDFEVYVGPHARQCCYEVGEEVFRAFNREPTRDRKISILSEVKTQLAQATKGRGRVYESGVCTICSSGFHSFRRDGDSAGRALNFVISS